MTTATSTKGRTVGIAQQSSLTNQPSSFQEIRTHEAITFPTDVSMAEAQPNLGHADAFDWSDEPIVYEGVRENGMTIPVAFRAPEQDEQPVIATLAESGGCAVGVHPSGGTDTIAAYTDEGEFTLTAGLGSNQSNVALVTELNDGTYYPTLVSAYVESTKTVTPAMALPSAATATNDVQQMYTITPQTGQVDASKLLATRVNTRGTHTTSEDLAWTMYGCALGAFGDITIEPQGQAIMSPTFHVADVVQSADALDDETFIDTTYLQRNQGNFRFEFQTVTGGAGDVAYNADCLLKATVTLGHTTAAIPGDGDSACLNSIQGYMAATPEQPKVVLEVLFEKTYWDTFTTTGNVNKHIGFVWGRSSSAMDQPAYAIWMPNCYQMAPPTADVVSENYIKAILTYGATGPDFTYGSGNNGGGMAPWVMAINGNPS